MILSNEDIKVIRCMMEELRMYRSLDEEPREMTENGLYGDEIALADKLGILVN